MKLKHTKSTGKKFGAILKASADEFSDNDPIRLASSTSFFTIFSIAPILVLVINIMGVVYKTEILSGELYGEIESIFGAETASLIQDIATNFTQIANNQAFNILVSIFLAFVATTLFIVMQNSLNQIFKVKDNAKHSFLIKLQDRGISLLIILFSGILFFAAVFSETIISFLSGYLEYILPNADTFFISAANKLVSLLVVVVWFAIVFKYLPYINIKWKPVWAGAAFTGVLFAVGKVLLDCFLINSNIGDIYGTSASIILLLLFVFYSSMIFYFGATFTKNFAERNQMAAKPKKYAMRYRIAQVD